MKLLALPLTIAVAFSTAAMAAADKKPKISLTANPTMGMSPLRVVVTAALTGVSNTTDDFYCPSVEWEWGDDTRSTTSADCDPFEAGKSEIKTTFTADHTYQVSGTGEYRVQFRLKKKDKTIGTGSTSIRVRPGLGDPGGGL